MEQKAETKPKGVLIARYLKLDTKKKVQYAVILLIVIVILAILFYVRLEGAEYRPGGERIRSMTAHGIRSVRRRMEDSITAAAAVRRFPQSKGAGCVEVMITYEIECRNCARHQHRQAVLDDRKRGR